MSLGVLGDGLYREEWEEEETGERKRHEGRRRGMWGEGFWCWWLLGFQGNLNERECVFFYISWAFKRPIWVDLLPSKRAWSCGPSWRLGSI